MLWVKCSIDAAQFEDSISQQTKKHLYSICTTSAQQRRRWADNLSAKRLQRICTNVILMFCIHWDGTWQSVTTLSSSKSSSSKKKLCIKDTAYGIIRPISSPDTHLLTLHIWSLDVGPTLYKCYTNVLHSLGWHVAECHHPVLFKSFQLQEKTLYKKCGLWYYYIESRYSSADSSHLITGPVHSCVIEISRTSYTSYGELVKHTSLGAKFLKAASFWVGLTQKVAKVWYVHMTGKYSWNINRVGVEVDHGSKVFKMRDVQGYPRAPKTVHF